MQRIPRNFDSNFNLELQTIIPWPVCACEPQLAARTEEEDEERELEEGKPLETGDWRQESEDSS